MRHGHTRTRGWTATAGCFVACLLATALARAEVYVPEALEPWQDWVLDGEEFRRCPAMANRVGATAGHVCAWPGTLDLEIFAQGGKFTQSWRVYEDSWVTLPGEASHWPRDVGIAGRALPVVELNGQPTLRLPPGRHEIAGVFQWSTRPSTLRIPSSTGLLRLAVDGRAIAQPERTDAGVWLGEPRRSTVASPTASR